MSSLEQAIERHIADLRRYARALLGDLNEADDLVQECLVRALARPHFWQRIRDPRAYLFAILHNAHVDRLSSQRRAGNPIQLDHVAARLSHAAPQPASLELRDLARALAMLAPEQREIVLLVGLEGMSYQEAAEVVGIPLGTVMSRLSRGREALRRMMEGEQRKAGKSDARMVMRDAAHEERLLARPA